MNPALSRLRSSRKAVLLAAAALMLVGVALRVPNDSRHELGSFIGSWSDPMYFYFRHHFAAHPVPYFDYRLEYPVLTGLLIWVVGFAHSSVTAYLLATAVAMIGCGLAVVLLLDALPGAKPWLFALAPALILYVVLNWDLFAIALALGALVLFFHGRDGLSGIVLALSVWAKFFPLLILPLLVLVRTGQRRLRDAGILLAGFVITSVAVNAPVALKPWGGGLVLRKSWSYFFHFNSSRPPVGPCPHCGTGIGYVLWTPFRGVVSIGQVDVISAALLALGMLAICMITWRAFPLRREAVIAPALLALFAWFFFLNKVYSPQYALWIVALLAMSAAPVSLLAVFSGVDLLYFVATFGSMGHSPFANDGLLLTGIAREIMLLVIVAWALARLLAPFRASARELEKAPGLEIIEPGAGAQGALPVG